MKIRKRLGAGEKLLALLASAFLLFNVTACKNDEDDDNNDKKKDEETEKVEEGNGSQTITVEAGASIQAKLNELMKNSATGEYLIKLPAGTYEEKLYYNGSATIILSGQGTAEHGTDVVIAASNSGNTNEMKNYTDYGPTSGYLRCITRFDGSANVILENLTIKNTYARSTNNGSNTQGEVLLFNSTGHFAAYNCSFLGHHDTLQTEGKAWFYNCYIEGDVDFTWIEHTAEGSVALYENCTLKALGDESDSAYFAAPRLIGTTSSIGKGEVFLNSALEKDGAFSKGLYLARSVAASTDVDQVAFIKCNSSTITDLTAPWKIESGKPFLKEGISHTIIGWKMDKTTASNIGYTSSTGYDNDILSDDEVSDEFSGRRAILNRVYDTTTGKYKKDANSYWAVDTLIRQRNWSVDEDTSKELLDDEVETSVVVYDFVSTPIENYSDLTATGFADEIKEGKRNGDALGQKDATISFTATDKAVVTVTGYYKGEGTIKAGSQGDVLFNFNNGSTSKTLDKKYVVYEKGATVTITATDTTYITKITVEYDSTLTFVPVSTITVSAAADEVASKKTLQFTATLDPATPSNPDIVWSIIAGDSVASIDQNGLLTAGSAAKDTEVTVQVASRDANAVTGTKTITVKELVAGAFDISWLDSDAHSDVSAVGYTDGNADVATGGNGTLSTDTSVGAWSKNTGKWGDAKGGLSYTTTGEVLGFDKVYVDFPVTAAETLKISQVTVTYGDHGTGNAYGKISYSLDDGSTFTDIATDSADNRKTTKNYDASVVVTKGKKAIIRVALGNEATGKIASGKALTICTVVVSGETFYQTYAWDFYGATNNATTFTDTKSGKEITASTALGVNANYGIFKSSDFDLTIPVDGKSTVIAYVTYYKQNTTDSLQLFNGNTSVGTAYTVATATALDQKNISGQPYAWYVNDATAKEVTLKVKCSDQFYIGRIYVDNVALPTASEYTYDFSKGSYTENPFSTTAEEIDNLLFWTGYVSNSEYVKKYSNSFFSQNVTPYLTFPVPGACTITVNVYVDSNTANSGDLTLYDGGLTALNVSGTVPSATGSVALSYTGAAGIVQLALAQKATIQSIKVKKTAE